MSQLTPATEMEIQLCKELKDARSSLATAVDWIKVLEYSYYMDQGVTPDGELMPLVSKVLKRLERAEEREKALKQRIQELELGR